MKDAVLALTQALRDVAAQLAKAGAVGHEAVAAFGLLIFTRLELGRCNLLNLELQHVDLLLAGALGVHEFIQLGLGGPPQLPGGGVGAEGGLIGCVFVQHVQLPILRAQRLVIMRAVEIHQELTHGFQHMRGGG